MKISKLLLLVLPLFILCSHFSPPEQPTAHIGFTTSQDLKTITPIDLETGISGKPIELEFSPKGIAISEKTQKAYVLQENSNQIIPLDLESRQVLEAIILESIPKQIVISENGLQAYITIENSNELVLLDLVTEIPRTLTFLSTIPSHITLSNDGKTLYTSSIGSNEITPIDLELIKEKSSIHLSEEPVAIAMVQENQMASIGHNSLNQLNFFDLETGDLNSSLTVDDDFETIHMTKDGKKAYLTHENSKAITPINLKEKSKDKSISTEHNIQSFALIEKKNLEASFTVDIKPAGQPSLFKAKKQSSLFGGTVQYIWDFGDDHVLSTEKPYKAHIYQVPGKYSVTLTVKTCESENVPRSTSVTKQVNVIKNQGPLFDLNPSLAQTETTSTSLNASPNPSAFNQSVTFTATVTSPGPGTPTGTVTFFDGATSIGTGTLNGSGVATFSTSTLSLGSHSITADYAGDATFFPSNSSPVTQVVNQATTTTAVTSSLNPSRFGQNVTFTATVTTASGTPTGTVTFFDGATTLGTGTLSGSTATLATSALTVAAHSITAVYAGDTNFSGSTSPALTQTVNQGTTSTAVTSSANPSIFGNSVTFTATVNVVLGAGTPTGTVTFRDGVTTIGTGTLSGSTATFSTSALAVGPHSITAVYAGDTNFSGSTSSAVTQVVNQGTTTTTVASSLNPSTYGASVTFTSITAVATGAGTPTGTVTFFDGATNLGTSTVNGSGVATLAVFDLSVGSHSITAVYSGDTNFTTSTSTFLTQVVDKATPTILLTSSLNPSIFGDIVTFTGTVSSPTSLGLPVGTVSFFDGATLIGTGTLIPTGANTSAATFSLSTLSTGSHSITAVYSGDTNFVTVTSPFLTQVVNQVSTTTIAVFSNSTNPTEYGQPVIFQATVTGSATMAPSPPSGTVDFYDGATLIGTATLNPVSVNVSQAIFTTTSLSLGAHSITATYPGDVNYPGATSLPYVQNVIQTGTSSVVTSSANPSVVGESVTFSSVVSANTPGMGNATGTVLFYDGTMLVGSGTLTPTGPDTSTATFTTSALTLGTHRIFTIYPGDTNFTSSTSPVLLQVVNQDTTTTTLTSSLNPSNFGDSITLTATVTADAPGSGTPTGTVQFFDGATLLATRTLSGGSTTYSTIALYPGTHSLKAVYSGDANFTTSTSTPLSQVVVNQLPTVTTITSSRNSSPVNQAVTYSARVTAITGVPTGTVTFYDLTVSSTIPIGTGTLVNGVATVTEPGTDMSLGTHQIEAVYNGDANFITSTSAIFNQYVVPVDTAITLVTSPNPSEQANATFTATVSAISGGSGPFTGTVTFYENGILIPGTVTFDPNTGIATIMPNNLHFGAQNIVAIYSGDTTTFATATSNTVIQIVQQTDMLRTNTVLTTSLSSAYFCELVTLTATVTEIEGFYTPTGYVTFFSNDIAIGGAVLDQFGVARLPITTLPVGSLTLTAAYNSDSNYAYSISNNVNVTILQNTTTTVVTVIPNLSVTPYTQNLFFTATVTSDFGTPTGSVSFYNGNDILEIIDLDSNGQATYETATLEVGPHTIRAEYNEDPCFQSSTGSLNHTISKGSVLATYTGTPNPSVYGDEILLTATLSSNVGVYPTGTITFYRGTTVVGTSELVDGIAYFILKDVPAGVSVMRGIYSGDANYRPTNLPSFIQRVNKADTSTCIDGYSSNPSQYGQIITFNAKVSSSAETPTGTVVFRDGSIIIGTVALTDCGTATLDTSNLNLGANNITATYSGDSNFNSSVSSTYVQNIVKADTQTIAVSSTPNPSVFNSLVTFNVSVGNLGTGSEVPTGTVTGTFGSTVIGTGTLVNGLASFSTTALPAGVDTVIISYSGDTNFNASTVATTQTVTTLNTTSTLASSNNPSVYGQPVTFSVTVASTAGTPTGTISFLDGTTTLATETLNASGQASLTLSNLSRATHSITAVYSGSANLSGSTSNTISQVVNRASTTTALSSSRNPSLFGDNITFTALVSATSPGTGIPTGTVTFRNGATTIGTGNVNAAGMATFTISSLAVSGSPYSITAVYGGDTNFNTSTSSAVSQVVNKSATITAATATPNPSALGNSVTLNVSVTPVTTGSGIPTGTVTALYGSTVVGTATLNGSGQASFSTTILPAGNLAIVVQYAGDSNYLASSTTITEAITQRTSTTALSSSANPSVVGQNITFTATVSSVSGTPTGTVAFFDGTTALRTVTLNASGVATLSISTLAIGTHSITAVYSGDASNLGSTSPVLSQVVNQASTTTTLSSSDNPSFFGENVTFTALVSATLPGSGIPTGTVTFRNGATTIGTGTINSEGVATFTIATLAVSGSPYSITAVYGGDTNFATSTSSAVSQAVNSAAAMIAASSTPNPANAGSSIAFNATVSAVHVGTGIPTGTVTAYYGSTVVGTGTLDGSGNVTFSNASLPAGTLAIVFQYSGDTNFSAASTTITQRISQNSSTTALTSSVNPSLFGESVTFSATVTSASGTPTGTVNFFDGSTPIGTGVLNGSGVATFSTSTLSSGTHSITAVYSGDTNNGSSTSSALSQVVNQAATTTTLTSSLNPSVFSNAVTFTAQVTATAPGAGLPTGTVTFRDGATVIGVANVNSLGTAVFSTSSLSTGIHFITAVYNGDVDFTTSTSTAVSQEVTAANTVTTILSSTPNPSQFGDVVTFFATVTSGQGVPTGTVTFYDGATVLGTSSLSDGLAIFATPILAVGTHSITAVYSGDTNFNTSTSTPPYVQVVNQTTITITTVTTLTSSLNPSNYGDFVTFDVTVNPIAGPGTPTGVITLYNGSTPLTTVALVNGIASYSTSTLPAGNLNIVALYSGDSQYSSSTKTIVQVVNPIMTMTAISSSLNPSNFNDPVTFTANVTAFNLFNQLIPPTGSVTFFDGMTAIGNVILDNTGTAAFTTSSLSTGSHLITAVYNPDPNFATSSDSLTQVVDPATTTTFIITSNPNPSKSGDNVTFIGRTVSGTNDITGTLSFFDGPTLLGTAPLVNGIAFFSTSTLTVGTHTITATFPGNSNYAASTSAPYTQVVDPTTFTTVTTLSSSLNPSEAGDPVTFTASVTSGSGTPTGTVSFFDGGTSIGTVVLNGSGIAAFTTSSLTQGTHAITAIYSGDANFGPSTSNIVTQVVGASSIPNAPQNFQGCQLPNKFLNDSYYKIRLTWDPPRAGPAPTSYRIYSNASLTHLVAEVPGNQHFYQVFNTKKNKTYHYYIVAVSGSQVSASEATTVYPKNEPCRRASIMLESVEAKGAEERLNRL